MAAVKSPSQILSLLMDVRTGVSNISRIVQEARRVENYLLKGETQSLTEIDTAIANILADAADLRDEIIERITALEFPHQIVIRAGRDCAGFEIGIPPDPDPVYINTVGLKTLAGGDPYTGSPFGCLLPGDVLEISNAEQPDPEHPLQEPLGDNNGVRVAVIDVAQQTGVESITVSLVKGPIWANAEDRQMVLTLVERA